MYKQSGNSVGPDQLAFQKPVNLDLYCFQNAIYLALDLLQSLKQFFINVPYHILVASLTLMALFKTEQSE